MRHQSLFILACMTMLLSLACDSADNQAPELLPLQEQAVLANEAINLQIFAKDAEGDLLSYAFTLNPPPITQTQGQTSIPTIQQLSNTQAIFQWVPGIADVGIYELTIEVKDASHTTQESIRLEVKNPSNTMTSSFLLSFTKPIGVGTTLNIAQSPCLQLPIEVKADDFRDDQITIQFKNAMPLSNASLSPPASVASKQKTFEFCPSEEQLNQQLRFFIELDAFVTENPTQRTSKRFLIQIERPQSLDCPNNPPTINHQPITQVTGIEDYPIHIEVLDDIGIKSAPLLSYLFNPMVDPRNTTEQINWQVVEFQKQGTGWQAKIPNMPLSEGQSALLYYQVIVTDNDDNTGALCDHTTKTAIYPVEVIASTQGQQLGYCYACSHSQQCGPNNVCLNLGEGQYCGLDCTQSICPNGSSCLEISSGVKQCVPDRFSCEQECLDDRYDLQGVDLLSAGQQPLLTEGTYMSLSICQNDLDLYLIDFPPGQGLLAEIEFDNQAGDLDLFASVEDDQMGNPIFNFQSNSADQNKESIQIDCPRSIQAMLVVQPYENAINRSYQLNIQYIPESCENNCENDRYEAQENMLLESNIYEGLRICPNDNDRFIVQAQINQIISVYIAYSPGLDELELNLYDGNQNLISRSYSSAREALLETKARYSGEYWLEIKGKNSNGTNQYDLSLLVFDAQPCQSTRDCAENEYCVGNLGACLDSLCDAQTGCALGHQCAIPQGDTRGKCLSECIQDQSCRSGEACKQLSNYQRLCAPMGNLLLGASCEAHEDCSDKLACTEIRGEAKCFTGGCDQNLSCPNPQICTIIDQKALCLPPCDFGCPAGLSCQTINQRQVCAP